MGNHLHILAIDATIKYYYYLFSITIFMEKGKWSYETGTKTLCTSMNSNRYMMFWNDCKIIRWERYSFIL